MWFPSGEFVMKHKKISVLSFDIQLGDILRLREYKTLSAYATIFLIFILFTFYSTCERAYEDQKPAELIEFIRLQPGIPTKINVDELFFAKSYRLKFKPNPHIKIQDYPDSGSVMLTPDSTFSGLAFIEFSNHRKSMIIPVIVSEKIGVTFKYRPSNRAANVFIMGNFNNWSRTALPMEDEDGDGVFIRQVLLDDGVYEYQFVVDKNEIRDPLNPEKVDNGFGAYNSLLRVVSTRKKNAPMLYFLNQSDSTHLLLAIQSPVPDDSLQLVVLQDNSLYPSSHTQIQHKTAIIDLRPLMNEKKITTLRIVASYLGQPGNILTVWLKNGRPITNTDTFLWQDATIYSLMIDRFADGDTSNNRPVKHPLLDLRVNFQGGDFAGITKKISEGYFDSLGINTIWISPVNKTTELAYKEWPEPYRYYSGYHGYWPVSSHETEPRFGSMNELKTLVKTAHSHNIKVLLDFVSNHTHIEHPWYTEHRDWYGSLNLPDGTKNIRRWDEYRLTTWFDTFLPALDYERSPKALETMTDNAIWWMKNVGFDGFRHDATKHVPQSFWKRLTYKIKDRINLCRTVNVFQIGESYGGLDLIKSYVNNGLLDSQFNFEQYFTLRRIITDPNGDFRDLASTIMKIFEVFGYNHLMGNILDNPDQVRIMAFLDGDLSLSDNGVERAWQEPPIIVDKMSSYQKELMLMTYLMTVPGVPVILYGDEFGMTGANDPDNRRMMRFGNQLTRFEKQQREVISHVIKIRKEHPALRRGDYLLLYADKDILCYSRGDTNERLLIALNKNEKMKAIELRLPAWIQCNSVKSLLSDFSFPVENHRAAIQIPPYSGDILLGAMAQCPEYSGKNAK